MFESIELDSASKHLPKLITASEEEGTFDINEKKTPNRRILYCKQQQRTIEVKGNVASTRVYKDDWEQ